MNSRFGLNSDFVVAPIFFLILMSLALCLLTSSLRLLALALFWNLIFVAAGFVFVYAGAQRSMVRMTGMSLYNGQSSKG